MAEETKDPTNTDPIILGPDAVDPAGAGEKAASEPSQENTPEMVARAEVDKLHAQIQARDKEITELKDKYLRALAETENTRKRMRQQSEETVRLQREALLRDLLPIIDNLERAVDAARDGGNGKPIVEGVEMVLRTMHDFLRNHGVTPLDAVGQLFDPQFHEAVEHVDSEVHEPNTVVQEHHRGYKIGDRTLRPARVSVAKAAEKQQSDEESEKD